MKNYCVHKSGKTGKKICGLAAGLLGLLFFAGQPADMAAVMAETGLTVQQTDAEVSGGLPESPEDLEPDFNDPDYVKRLNQPGEEAAAMSLRSVSARTTKSPFTGLTYTHAARLSDCDIVNGIDVSKWQAGIDWTKVKKAGVKYVFIRCGYTSLSSFTMYEDQYFKQNIKGAYNAGIKVGIYYFSTALNTSEAEKEAQKTLQLIEPYRDMITMPVIFDFETVAGSRSASVTKTQATKNLITYLKAVQAEGYTPMYYGNPSDISKFFDTSQLTDYECWLANYTTKTSYEGDYSFWQYSSSGTVDGISGSTDCNFYYTGVDEPEDPVDPQGPPQVMDVWMLGHTTDSITVAWEESEGASGYKIYRSKYYGGPYRQVKIINEEGTFSWLDTSVLESEGRQYYYKIVPYTEDGEIIRCGAESEILTAYTERLYSFRLKTTAALNLRAHPGTEYEVLATVPAGTGLPYYKWSLASDDSKWYKVTYKKGGVSYVGYLSGKYVNTYTYGRAKKNINVRSGAGLDYGVRSIVPEGVKMTILSNTTDSSGTKWSRVNYKKNGKTYTGYVPAKYIKRI